MKQVKVKKAKGVVLVPEEELLWQALRGLRDHLSGADTGLQTARQPGFQLPGYELSAPPMPTVSTSTTLR